MNYLLIPFFCYTLQFLGIQAMLEITLEFAEVKYRDPEYFKDMEFYVDEDNDLFINMTIIKSLPEDTTVHFTLRGKTLGEFKIPIGFDYKFPGSEIFDSPMMIGPFLNKLGIDEFPFLPGIYGIENYHINVQGLPDEFIPNSYMATTKLFNNQKKKLLEVIVICRIS